MFTVTILLLGIIITGYIFTRQLLFGAYPKGDRLSRIKHSPNYRDGQFQNIHPTPSLAEGVSYYKVFKEFFFEKKPGRIPVEVIPSIKTDLKIIPIEQDVLVWFGHSSYYMQIDQRRILVDPVFCGHASPASFITKSFPGTDIYSAGDIPEIDYLFLTHDHWDHLDYETVNKLKPKIGKIITGLGVGQHLERWGFDMKNVLEKDWNEKLILDDGFIVHTVSARHFSGRGLKRNKSLWMSFALRTPTMNIFIGGDSGYDTHFRETGEKLGPFDLAILENGQYDKNWRYIHMLPDEIIPAAKELRAKRLLTVHNSKFGLSNHPWKDPLEKIIENNKSANQNILTPMIGELVRLKDENQKFSNWWENVH